MFYTSANLQHLESFMNEELKLVFKYCTTNNLSINLTKTNYIMVISSSRIGGHISIHKIERKSLIKYLGVFIDRNLHWGPQIQHTNNKLTKNVRIINKLRYYVDVHTLKQLYYSFIYPYLTYGVTCWGSACKTRLQKIKTKQNRCVRSIFFAHSKDSAMSSFQSFGNPHTRKHLQILYIKFINNDPTNIPAIFSGTLTLASEVHSYNTRFATNFNIYRPSISNNYGAKMFSFCASKIWESIPSELKKLSYNRVSISNSKRIF